MSSVGASLLFADDVIVTGCNVENASYGELIHFISGQAKIPGAGVCAERTAMTKAIVSLLDHRSISLNRPMRMS